MKHLLLFLSSLYAFSVFAQTPCADNRELFIFQANRIGAAYTPRGLKHFDFHDGYFKVPYTSERSTSSIFASSPWLGAMVGNDLRLSGQTFASPEQDLFVGPLAPDGTPYGLCDEFNHVWYVTRDEIEEHIQDFAADGVIDRPLPGIFGWPAQGNDSFESVNGFALPADHQGGWASFTDLNQNGIYEPQLGEYPDVVLKGNHVIPQAIGWMVFNDNGPHQVATTDPLKVEIQLTVFGFQCEDNPMLNNTLFNTYTIINQNDVQWDSTYFGIWSDYDLGCAADDYLGCDSIRSTEFVYNDEVDGDSDDLCSTGPNATYGYYPPVQSMTYLHPAMHSFVISQRQSPNPPYPYFTTAAEQYNLLTGLWADGRPIKIGGNGYSKDTTSANTHYWFSGDPRDPNQWSWWQYGIMHMDPMTVSSSYLGTISPGETEVVETAYSFHQDSALNHLEQLGFMYANVDALLDEVDDVQQHCQLRPTCLSRDCVWPGDFNHNGIADHYDLLYWGVMRDSLGESRDGRINWTGHFADPWSLVLPDDLDAHHGDGNGDGKVDDQDLERNVNHFLLTNPYYVQDDHFPAGPEITLTGQNMNDKGQIRNLYVHAGKALEHIYGLAFEVDFDTSLYQFNGIRIPFCPGDSNTVCFEKGIYRPEVPAGDDNTRYAFVKTDHQEIMIDSGYLFLRLAIGFYLKPGKTFDDVPDTVTFRLKNLIALDAMGNDLHIGANVLKIPKYLTTAVNEQTPYSVNVFPNPCTDEVWIEGESLSDIRIFDLYGRMVMKKQISSPQTLVSLTGLASGVYFISEAQTGSISRLIKQ